jgi:hypothetical protein
LVTLPTTFSPPKHLLPSDYGHDIGNETRIRKQKKERDPQEQKERSTMEGNERTCKLKKAHPDGQTSGSHPLSARVLHPNTPPFQYLYLHHS